MKTLKLTLSILLLFVSTLSIAQKRYKGDGNVITKERSIGTFDQLTVKGPFNVELTSGQVNALTITTDANLMEQIVTEVNDKTLTIRLKKQSYLKPTNNKPIHIKAPLTSLNALLHAGSGKVFSNESFSTNTINVDHSGSGKIQLKLEAQTTAINLSGSGKIQLRGTSTNVNAKLSGSGNIRLADFKAENGEAKLSGSGNIDLNCSKRLTAKISGSGNIRYKEEPSQKLISKVSGSGAIRPMN